MPRLRWDRIAIAVVTLVVDGGLAYALWRAWCWWVGG